MAVKRVSKKRGEVITNAYTFEEDEPVVDNSDDLFGDIFDGAFDDYIQDAAQFSERNLKDHTFFEKERLPVGVVQFAEDARYLGLSGKIFKSIKHYLEEIESDEIREASLILGKGSGKSVLAQVFTLYGIYYVMQLKNPQAVFKLLPGTPLVSINVSVGLSQAKNVVFEGIKNLVQNSKYFKGRYKNHTLAVKFQKNVYVMCGHSNFTAFLGYPIFRAVMDEVNFMVDNNNRSVASQLYGALSGSLKTRFPGFYKLVMISSDSTPTSFLRERVQVVKDMGDGVQTTTYKPH